MDTIKKIMSDHHAQDSTAQSNTVTNTDQQHSNLPGGGGGGAGAGAGTGGNMANPLSEPGTSTAATTSSGTGAHQLDDRGTAHGYGTGVGAPTTAGGAGVAGGAAGEGPAAAAAGGGAGGGVGDSYEPGVNAGGTRVVEARMPAEEGNNFPGTNPNPAHNALGTSSEGGLSFPGSE